MKANEINNMTADELNSKLQDAIKNQEFEKAAQLRDQIKEFKANRGGNQ